MYHCNEMTTKREENWANQIQHGGEALDRSGLSLGGIDGNILRQREVEAMYHTVYVSFILIKRLKISPLV